MFLIFSGVVMHSQIYRGVFHYKNPSVISKSCSKFNFAYRGIIYLKSVVEKKQKNILNMNYRGISFKKIDG